MVKKIGQTEKEKHDFIKQVDEENVEDVENIDETVKSVGIPPDTDFGPRELDSLSAISDRAEEPRLDELADTKE